MSVEHVVKQVREARCPNCGPRRYYITDEDCGKCGPAGTRVELPGEFHFIPGLPLECWCGECGEQIMFYFDE